MQLQVTLKSMCHLHFLPLGIKSCLEGDLSSTSPCPPHRKTYKGIRKHHRKGRMGAIVTLGRGPSCHPKEQGSQDQLLRGGDMESEIGKVTDLKQVKRIGKWCFRLC